MKTPVIVTLRHRCAPVLAGLLLTAVAACASGGSAPPETSERPTAATSSSADHLQAAATADSLRNAYTRADVEFMRGMIHHHAQALTMARMAPSHGAGERMLTLTTRILNSQRAEIGLMQAWLRDRGEPVPEVEPDGTLASGRPLMRMAGMLTDRQMAELREARGTEFDRLFLVYMIQHHKGALTMVDELFASHGAAQNQLVFKLASDIAADQASEIERMQKMLRQMVFQTGGS